MIRRCRLLCQCRLVHGVVLTGDILPNVQLRPAVPWTQGQATNSRAYARLTINRQLEIDANEIRTRSDRPARRTAMPSRISRERQQLVEAYEAAAKLDGMSAT